jgi:hypothetical protein
MIHYLKHSEIDKEKWNECIQKSDNRNTEVLSWYLDIVCPGWEALILDDYKIVMPLPVKRKFGISYIYIPLFIQQLGLFGNALTEEMLELFLNNLPPKIKLADIILNEHNIMTSTRYLRHENTNYKLNINISYKVIKEHYNRNCQRNIRKAELSGLIFHEAISINEFNNLLEPQIRKQVKSFERLEKRHFRLLLEETLKRKAGEIVGVYDSSDKLVAAGFYVYSYDKLLFKICGSTPEGKRMQAMYLLVDEQIKRYCKKYEYYDFQGSNIEGIAYFNSTFGAIPSKYYSIRVNKLPLIVKVISGK